MASEQQVKRYLAYWFQLGKQVVIHNGQTIIRPQRVIAGERYSEEFEQLWQYLLSPESGDSYLEATPQTIAELLTSKWDIEPCARCDMPVPMFNVGIPPDCCTCNDLPTWPNLELPQPRDPVSTQEHLSLICDRLEQTETRPSPTQDSSISDNGKLKTPSKPTNTQADLSMICDRLQQMSHPSEPEVNKSTFEDQNLTEELKLDINT